MNKLTKEHSWLERRWYHTYGLEGSIQADPEVLDEFDALLSKDPESYMQICACLLSRSDYTKFTHWIAIHLFETFVFRKPSLTHLLVQLCKENERAFESLDSMYYDEENNECFSRELSEMIKRSKEGSMKMNL